MYAYVYWTYIVYYVTKQIMSKMKIQYTKDIIWREYLIFKGTEKTNVRSVCETIKIHNRKTFLLGVGNRTTPSIVKTPNLYPIYEK